MAQNKPVNKTNRPQTKAPVVNTRPDKPENAEPKRSSEKWFIIILMAIAFIVNARTINYGYTYDDSVFTTEQTLIGLKGIEAIPGLFTHGKNYNFDKSNDGSYRPLLPISFCIEHQFFGFVPAVSHFINLVLFCLLILVLYHLLRRIFIDYSAAIPFFILLLYELHPIHTEVIASVKSRDELLSFLFTAMSMMQSFKYVDDNKNKHLVLSAVYFFLGLLSKESPVSFVGVVPLTLWFFTNAQPKKIIIAGIPYLISAVVFVLLGKIFLDNGVNRETVSVTENFLVAINGFSERLGTILFIQLKYFTLLLFPVPLSYDYSYNQIPIVNLTNIKAIIGLVLFVGMGVYAIMNLKRRDILSYCILFYFMTISVTSNLIIEIGTAMGERLLFVPSLAFCIAVVFMAAKLLKANAHKIGLKSTPAFSYLLIGIALLYSVKTIARNEVWKSNFDLFTSGVASAPNSWRTQNSLAVELREMANRESSPELKRKYLDEAIVHFNKSLEIFPQKGEIHAEIGVIYFTDKRYDSAAVHLRRALEINPRISSAAANLGTVYLTVGKFNDALHFYQKAIAVDPGNITAQFNEAVCFVQLQKHDSAVLSFKKAVMIDPRYNDYKGLDYTAIVFKMMGKMDSAAKYTEIARKYHPGFTP
jgi:tetratricopeptide (TPR) repeat protein